MINKFKDKKILIPIIILIVIILMIIAGTLLKNKVASNNSDSQQIIIEESELRVLEELVLNGDGKLLEDIYTTYDENTVFTIDEELLEKDYKERSLYENTI